MKSSRFNRHRFFGRHLPLPLFRIYGQLFMTKEEIDELLELVTAKKTIESMMNSETPIFLRDDLVCMSCSKDLPAVDVNSPPELDDNGNPLPNIKFHFQIDVKTNQPTILCFDCKEKEGL